MKGKTALVTSSSRGLILPSHFAKEGADVVINYVTPSSKGGADKVATEIEGYGSKSLVADLASLNDIDSLVAKTVERFGNIDILDKQCWSGANATITAESYQSTLDINLRPVVFLSQAVVPHMGPGGCIINVTSTIARMGAEELAVYAASKAGAEAITRVPVMELRSKGIRVNSINPGPMVTDMFHGFSNEVQEAIRRYHPVGEPDDIAGVVTFLAGPNIMVAGLQAPLSAPIMEWSRTTKEMISGTN